MAERGNSILLTDSGSRESVIKENPVFESSVTESATQSSIH